MNFFRKRDFPQKPTSIPKAIALFVTIAYVVALLSLLFLMELVGERLWLLALFLFFPVQIWLLPLVVLTPVCLLLHMYRLIAIHGVCVLVVFLHATKWRWRPAPPVTERTLICVTNNIGESNRQSMRPFLEAEKPDIIALQEASGRAPAYRRAYPGWFVAAQSQFVLISKFPIERSATVPGLKWRNRPIAATFELNVRGMPLVIYNVHFPTPRPAFEKLHGRGIVRELLGRNRSRSDNQSFSESVAERVALAQALTQVFEQEKRPFLAMGDFNTPDHGYIYRLFASRMTDAFAKSGRGFGWTFPGYTSNPLTFFGPWLRLDYLFAGNGWQSVYARAEPRRRSQHRAVAARFEPL